MVERFIAGKFDFAIYCFKNNLIEPLVLMRMFLDKEFFVPSMVEDDTRAQFICPSLRDKKQIVVFTSERLLYLFMMLSQETNDKQIKSYFIFRGSELIKKIPKNHGVIINPGFYINPNLTSQGIKNLKRL